MSLLFCAFISFFFFLFLVDGLGMMRFLFFHFVFL